MNSEANLQIPVPRGINNPYTSSSSSSSSPPDFRRNIQAYFKRHRPLGTMQSSSIGPRRTLVPQCDPSKILGSNAGPNVETKKHVDLSQSLKVRDSTMQKKNTTSVVGETQEDTSITPPSFSGTSNDSADKKLPKAESHQLIAEKIQFSTTRNAGPREMEWDTGDEKNRNHHNVVTDDFSRSEVGASSSSLLAKRTTGVPDQFKNFLSQPVTQSSVVRSSCATTTNIHSTSAPMLNSTTNCSRFHTAEKPSKELHHLNQEILIKPSNPLIKDTGQKVIDHKLKEENDLLKEQQGCVQKEGDIPKEPSKARQQEKAVSSKAMPRKRNYDPDLFFKVNGKLYQRLGKIGSGGSSEVHKVISSDCKIFALKKIKLKGRDYATAFGFCQEIEYLSRLKGKSNIIQLIDYEVTDKALLREVMSGSISNKDGKVKDDGYIYMVLEYGEIDLAHMLSHKWKELDTSNQTIDESWLRFYWQQILLAVNTIHEERIVHSDLKPANFLLVKGSLKLIDFGIAKAIMSDTTNIQRDSQVGTLSYMSPEAFMCNEQDADGNIIKCGRPSDIWSLGCILYQMVYGRTPFAEHKTFWAKFKVITDPNHKIKYEPLSNPWLLDIMKKCLAWDRNKRWRIPELLQHPFLVPPIPQPHLSEGQNCKLLRFIAEASANDPEASVLCSELEQLLREPVLPLSNSSLATREQQCKLLGEVAKLCRQLQERLTMSE